MKDIKEELDNKTAHNESLKAHHRSKHGELELRCKMCDFKSIHGNSMLFHKNSVHGDTINDVGEFKCDSCDKMFRRANGLRRHKLAKHQMIRFQCVQCDSNYSSASGLSLHVRRVAKCHGYGGYIRVKKMGRLG